jgi:hypothetical protein
MTLPQLRASRALGSLALTAGSVVALSAGALAGGGDPGEVAAPLAAPPPPLAALEGPWRLGEAVGAPEWLDVGGEIRPRFESLSEDFRKGRTGSVSTLNWRTLVDATATRGSWRITGELLDSRVSFVDVEDDSSEKTVYNTALVNELELLQGFVGYRDEDVLVNDDRLDVQVGRQTIILGSRRHVHRNGYRNTINAFTGARATWDLPDGAALNAFYVVPIRRFPDGPGEIGSDEIRFDEELWDTRFWTLHYKTGEGRSRRSAEIYVYGLNEENETTSSIRVFDRNLLTFGMRIDQPGAPGDLILEWEASAQVGTSKLPGDEEEKDHRAFFTHLTLGKKFETWGSPRAELLFDYGSGDQDPDDDTNERYDTLYGVPAFEWGVTNIFAPFDRVNAVSPGARVQLQPTGRTKVELMFRSVWLASDRDAWTRAGLQDPTGQSGSHIGDLTQLRVRHDLIPKGLQLDLGAAYLDGGEFMQAASAQTDVNAPNYGPGSSNVSYVWLGLLFTF